MTDHNLWSVETGRAFEAALKIAVEIYPKIEECTEMESAFIFHRKKSMRNAVVVLKANLSVLNLPEYRKLYPLDTTIRDFGLVLEDLIIDRWNCNAIVNVCPNTPEQQALIDELNVQLD